MPVYNDDVKSIKQKINYLFGLPSNFGIPTDFPEETKKAQKAARRVYISSMYPNRRVRHLYMYGRKARTRKKNAKRAARWVMKHCFIDWAFTEEKDNG